MPYIISSSREALGPYVLAGILEDLSPGELNYLITSIVLNYWTKSRKYSTIAEISGVLENVKQEFYRRVAVPYEEKKRAENGDVY